MRGTVSFELDVTIVGVDEDKVRRTASDIIELCLFLLDEDRGYYDIVAGALLAATMMATDMGETVGPMQ